ncbi:aldo/keto reductase [Halioxenophilus sp. WMMB6]|uniref:aldo/keto reductase n=1 Tax=Halioxenophilus sp. WMMB6 TaxID=3073815 RepID=UPI00295E9249|nr:aldo/keto reductase [Halioxenophilus sp. WMMB6]
MILEETYTLANGVAIPKLGLGTWFISNDDAASAVQQAVELGYRHIDTAQAYGNEAGVGEGVRNCGVEREQLFVTTKLDAGIKTYNEAVASIDGSLQTLGLDYIDLMIIHSPQPWGEFGQSDRHFAGNLEAWRALEEAYNAGKLRAIGLSNFLIADIDNMLQGSKVKPMVNQILAHVSNTPSAVIKHCQDNGIIVEAYSPIGHGELLKNPSLIDMAKKYNVSVPQLCIRYTLQLGLVSLPKTSNPVHMKSNADLDFEISAADMATLQQMKTIENYGDASVFPVYGVKQYD